MRTTRRFFKLNQMHGKNNYLSNKSSTKILAHMAKVNKYMGIFLNEWP